MNTTMKQLISWVREDLINLGTKVDKLDEKIDSLQNFKWKVIGYSAGTAATLTILASLIWGLMR